MFTHAPSPPPQIYIVEGNASSWPQPPKTMPACPSSCLYNFAPYTKSYVNDTYGSGATNAHDLP